MHMNKEGQSVPDVTFKIRDEDSWREASSHDIFAGRTVIVFALPGAFTPTCSSAHVPRYNQLAATFKAEGVDEIICLAVNDPFVMNEWRAQQGADALRFLADGNGDFTRGMGMLVNKGDLGFGERSWRYSMLVRDGIIARMFIEPDEPGDPFTCSDADTMLAWLAPHVSPPPSVAVFSRPDCPHCSRAKRQLHDAGIVYDELVLNRDFSDRTLRAISPTLTYPRIFVDGVLLGGAQALEQWLVNTGRRTGSVQALAS